MSSTSLPSYGFTKRIFKSPIESFSTCGKNKNNLEDITRLNMEIDRLKCLIETLQVTMDGKEKTIGNLASEKQKLSMELKKLERTNRNIQQQLEDERCLFLKEKEHLNEELNIIKRLSRNVECGRLVELEKENERLKYCLNKKTLTVCNLCQKYLRMKMCRDVLKAKLFDTIATYGNEID